MTEEVTISARSIEIRVEKDSDGKDLFFISLRHLGNAGKIDIAGTENLGTASSWELVQEKIAELNVPSRLLSAAKKQVEASGFAVINMSEVNGL
jgi:hypothetical protein